jgi:hypothetical protein
MEFFESNSFLWEQTMFWIRNDLVRILDPTFQVVPDPDPTLKPDQVSNSQNLVEHEMLAAILLKHFKDILRK